MNAQDVNQAFDFTFDQTLDPMGDFLDMDDFSEEDPGPFLPNVEGRTEFLPPDAERIPVMEHAVKQDTAEYAARPAEERTRELFGQMAIHKDALLAIIDATHAPCSMAEVARRIAASPAKKFSVYAPSTLCTMLETAGALERVTDDGTPYDTQSAQPRIETIDGEDYYVPTNAPQVCWRATTAGLAMLAEQDPSERLHNLFEKEHDLLPIHKRVLTMASEEQGATMAQLSAAVDGNPLIAEPRRFFVQHFVEGLERAGALAWHETVWKTTEIGRDALGALANVDDQFTPPLHDENERTIAAETDGIKW